MIIKSTFKSHFKIKKQFLKNKQKTIFVKNIFIFLLFSKIFLKNCRVCFFFLKHKVNQTNILKAPSRHKKFFHQVYFEYFLVKTFFKYKVTSIFLINQTTHLFDLLNIEYLKIGSNTLTRTKFSTTLPIKIKY